MQYRTVMLALAGLGALAYGQTRIDLGRQAKNVDFSNAASTKPSKTGTTLPGTCSAGEEFFKTDAPPGQNKYGCTAQNTWSLLGAVALLPGQRGNDFVLGAGPTALTVMPGARLFGVMTLSSAGCTYTITGGSASGLAYVYFTDSGQVVLDHPAGADQLTLSAAGTDCQSNAVTTPAWPSGMNFHPIGTVGIDAGRWGTVTQSPVLTAGWYVACSAHLQCRYTNGTVVVDVGSSVLTAGSANALTGSLDASLAQFLTVPQGPADPNACAQTGQLFFNTTSAALKTSTATGPPCVWTATGAGGGGGGGNVTGNNLTTGQVLVGNGGSAIAASGKTLPAGALVGDSDAQVLSNKTLAAAALQGSTLSGTHTLTGVLDASGAVEWRLPNSASQPPACHPGDQYFNTTAARQRVCTSENVWSDAAAGPHALLGETHSDTLAGAVQRGDLITGQQGSAKWARLAKGSSGQLVGYDANDVRPIGLGANLTGDGAEVRYDPGDAAVVNDRDDFGFRAPSTYGTLPWNAYASPGTASLAGRDSELAHPGITRLGSRSATPAANDYGLLTEYVSGNGGIYPNMGAGGAWTAWTGRFIIRPDATGSAGPVTNTVVYAGWTNVVVLGGNAFIGAAVSTTAVTCTSGSVTIGNWYFAVNNGNSKCVDTGVAAQAGVWYDFRFVSTTPGVITATLDGAHESTLDTYVPTAALAPGFRVITLTSAQKTLDLDFYSFQMRGLTR